MSNIVERTPMKHPGGVRQVANTLAILISDLASLVTAQAVNVDGGLEMLQVFANLFRPRRPSGYSKHLLGPGKTFDTLPRYAVMM
jgi:hypothetical protein